MEPEITGKLRRDIQKKVQKSGETYVYDRISMHNPETKTDRQMATRLIGKLPPGKSDLKDMIETRPKSLSGRDFQRRKAAEAKWEHWLHAFAVQEGIAPAESPAADGQDDSPRDRTGRTPGDAARSSGGRASGSFQSAQYADTSSGQGNADGESEARGAAAAAARFIQDFTDAEKVRAVLEGKSAFVRKTSYMADALLDWIGRASGIDRAVEQAFPGDRETAQKVLSMARFWTATQGEAILDMEAWSISHRLPYRGGISSDLCIAVMNHIGLDPSAPDRFFSERARRCPGQALFLVDSTTTDKGNDELPAAKVFTLFSAQTGEPISFFTERGSIPVVSNLIELANRGAQVRGKKVVKVILDSEFFSESNLSFISSKHCDVLMRAPIQGEGIQSEFQKVRGILNSPDNVCPFDTDVHCEMVCLEHAFPHERQRARDGVAAGEVVYTTHRGYLYFFLDEKRERVERHDFIQQLYEAKKDVERFGNTNCLAMQLQKHKNYLNVKPNTKIGGVSVAFKHDKIDEDLSLCGCFVIFSFKKMPNDEVLREYRMRERTEASFQIDKVFRDADTACLHADVSLDGRLFCQFVSLCYEAFLDQQLRDARARQSKIIADGVAAGTLTGQALEAEIELFRWLNSTSIKEIFHQLDAYKNLDLTLEPDKRERKDPTQNRDAMFFHLLGITSQ